MQRHLTQLKNIGNKIAGRLNKVGIFSAEELRYYGAAKTHQMIKEHHPDETLPLCYYLYSFAGALCDKHCNAIGWDRKKDLKSQIS